MNFATFFTTSNITAETEVVMLVSLGVALVLLIPFIWLGLYLIRTGYESKKPMRTIIGMILTGVLIGFAYFFVLFIYDNQKNNTWPTPANKKKKKTT